MKTIEQLLVECLSKHEKFCDANGSLLKSAVQTAALNLDKELLDALCSSQELHDAFFTKVDSVEVFDKVKFSWAINNSQFLPDSYTAFKNKIGLIDESMNYISQKDDVVVSFPYKDCVIEFDATNEDERRDEIFLNEIIAKKQIDSLLSNKVLQNGHLYSMYEDKDINIYGDQNLLIKGNNLIVMHSLLSRFEGKVKCMYWDILYNTKSDHVPYNDSFKHSSWLTMMKNRLEVGQKLLDKDGIIMLQCDDNEMAYLKVLCDEIFGREAFISNFNIQVRYSDKSLNEKSDFQPVNEYVLIYKKSRDSIIKPNKPYEDYSLDSFIYEIVEKTSGEDLGILGGKHVTLFRDGEYEIIKHSKGRIGLLKSTWASGSVLKGNTSGKFFDKVISERKDIDGLKCLYKVDGIGEDGLGYRYFTGPKKATTTKGLFYAGVPLDRQEEIASGKASRKYLPISNLYDFSPDFGNCRHEGGVELVGGKKPEVLLEMLLGIFTNDGDLVLDAYSGTGTTAAVCMKMNRRFIAIEQLDLHFEKSKTRLLNVINGDKTGISDNQNWLGGGEFVTCELAKYNEKTIEKISSSKTKEELMTIYNSFRESPFILNYKISEDLISDPKNVELFAALEIDDEKKVLIAMLEKNILYVNYSEMNDESYEIADIDKQFSKSFYGE